MLKRLAVFGGTFDPIHHGHMRLAIELSEYSQADALHYMPVGNPAHRAPPQASAHDRIQMITLATNHDPITHVNMMEVERQEKSYTLHTLEALQQEYPHHQCLLFIGADQFNTFDTWYHWQDILNYCHLIVADRTHRTPQLSTTLAHFAEPRIKADPKALSDATEGQIHFVSITSMNISSTLIRKLCAEQRNIAGLTSSAVCDYIKTHQLYSHPQTKVVP